MSGENFPGEGTVELEDRPREECGVFGIYAPGLPVAQLTYNGLQALQHRGEEGAGIAITENNNIPPPVVGFGKVGKALHEGDDIRGFTPAEIATGHVRYGTREADKEGLQPMVGFAREKNVKFTVCHNGDIANYAELLGNGSAVDNCETDSRLITQLIARALNSQQEPELAEAIIEATAKLNGAYSLVVMGQNKLFGVRDPHGFRPLVIGELPRQGWVVASEMSALDIVGADFIREVEPGEVVEIDGEGLHSHYPFPKVRPSTCAFEFFYLSRPENRIHGEVVAKVRMRLGERLRGEQLAKEHPVEADIVIGVPDTGTIAAVGYSRASGILFEPEALVKNRYVGRTFITPGQSQREHDVRVKLNPNRALLKGKRVVVVDDSLIRGTTTKEIVRMLRESGVQEVHLRIPSAPYMYPCVYGMNTGNQEELLAAKKDIEGMRLYVEADSLNFLSVEGIKAALGPAAGKVCMACMTGEYPTSVPQEIFKIKAPVNT